MGGAGLGKSGGRMQVVGVGEVVEGVWSLGRCYSGRRSVGGLLWKQRK